MTEPTSGISTSGDRVMLGPATLVQSTRDFFAALDQTRTAYEQITRELELTRHSLDEYLKAYDELHDGVMAVVEDLDERIGRLRFMWEQPNVGTVQAKPVRVTDSTDRVALALLTAIRDELEPLVRSEQWGKDRAAKKWATP